MKYIILVCDGAADWPIETLGKKTIFETANTPHMDWLASNGQMGMLRTIPDGMSPGSAVANMSIMGYQPEKDFTGRGPLEALSADVPLSKTDIAFRCNLVNLSNGLIKDYSSGHITTEESRPLINHLQSQLKRDGVDFFPGVQYRHLLRLDGTKYSEKINTTPPHDQLDKPYKDFLVKPIDSNNKKANLTADFINQLIEDSYHHLVEHEINKKRLERGKLMATHIWPWSGGKKPDIKQFKEKFGLIGSVISAVDLIFGIGIAAGLKPIHVKGATGLPDTNYEGKVEAALNELKEKDFIFLHVEAIDEMGHSGDPRKKISALQDFDQRIVKPILEAERKFNDELVIAVLPDHPTPCEIRTHTKEPVPFVIYNPKNAQKRDTPRNYSEKAGKEGECGLVENGEKFMDLFLS